jgi:methionine-S-sulfoxide reductase
VVRTRVGYSGGSLKDPTYHHLGDHAETIQIDYDPTKVTYEDLLEVFWNSHDPTRPAWSTQYMTAVFFHDEAQRNLALSSRDQVARRVRGRIATKILPLGQFYLAEAYHQKYRLRRERDLMAEFRAIYPRDNDFVDSTAAARVNGYLAGYGTCDALNAEVDRYGLSPTAQEKLRRHVCR